VVADVVDDRERPGRVRRIEPQTASELLGPEHGGLGRSEQITISMAAMSTPSLNMSTAKKISSSPLRSCSRLEARGAERGIAPQPQRMCLSICCTLKRSLTVFPPAKCSV
jgi:hypothetical protein